MDSGQESVDDVYGLVSRLCESIYKENRSQEQSLYRHPEEPADEQQSHLRRLKARAYEILLNKDGRYGDDMIQDPIVELLKYVYVLKIGAGKLSQAEELQKYLDEFIDDGLEQDSAVFSTLVFLNSLKSLESQDDESLDIFHYGKPHPQLPEMPHDERSVPPFQIYPIESFSLPNKFESTLNQDHSNTVKYTVAEPGSKLTLLGRLTSSFDTTKRTISNYSNTACLSSSLLKLPRCPTDFNGMESTPSSYFVPQIQDVERIEDQLQSIREGIVTEPESPWQSHDPVELFANRNLITRNNQTEICEIEDDDPGLGIADLDEIWENMDKYSPPPSHRTWETLGSIDPPKEPPFISESVEATLHVLNVVQDADLYKISSSHESLEIHGKKFLNNVKLLLLGVGSDSFHFIPSSGFSLKKDIVIHGISSGTLENLCYEVARWGTCFKNLTDLIALDPLTGKLQMEGLIFKALCHSIKEFLLFYHAAILRIPIDENGQAGLLKYMSKVRPLGNLILKVAELCRCEDQRLTSLGEGIGILTHIYKEVTKVTEPNVALVFYSILKDCCEAYFGFLQQWIFEGRCVDIYEEFMIKVRPQYLRTRSHRFWTRGFSINQQCVPGFLSGLADTILQCGKAVSLLRICDPQNPLCRVSSSSQPPVKVCLSVGMLREQNQFYQDYTVKGIVEQGESVTLRSAIQEEKDNERKRAELVMAAQEETLLRLKREREEALREILYEKHKLLKQLREQAEEVAERKEKAKDAELLADKLLLEKIQRHEEEIQNIERIEKENTIKYYNELAVDAKKRRTHADWRIKRMNLFDERVMSISNFRREFVNTPDDSKATLISSTQIGSSDVDGREQNPREEESNVRIDSAGISEVKKLEEREKISGEKPDVMTENSELYEVTPVRRKTEENIIEDENENPTCSNSNIAHKIVANQNVNLLDKQNQNLIVASENIGNTNTESQISTRAVRPAVLDIASVTTQRTTSEDEKIDNLRADLEKTNINLPNSGVKELTAAQRNRLKVLEQEFGFTPNNNETLSILTTKEISDTQSNQTEIQMNRLRNTQHLTHLNWNNVESNDPVENESLSILTTREISDTQSNQTEIQTNRLRNTQHLTHLNWKNVESNDHLENELLCKEISVTQSNQTEIQTNRLRNTQHLTHLNWSDIESDEPAEKLDNLDAEQTEIQINRLRNTQHLTDFNYNVPEVRVTSENLTLTDAQVNRNRIMAHTYNQPEDIVNRGPASENLSERQVNKNRNMAHNTQQYDFDLPKISEPENAIVETPMSTATDYFTASNQSTSPQMQSCANTPFSEITNHSDTMFAKSSDGGRSMDELASQDKSCSGRAGYFQDTPAFPHFMGLGSLPSSPTPERNARLTIADVEMIDTTSLQVYLEKSVVIPLTAQSRLVNNALIKYLLNEHKMLSHLHSLRSFFFLLNGEFAKTLTQSLFTRLYEALAPADLFNSSTLSNFLEKALVSSLSSTYANSELLSLSATEVPPCLQTSNPEILSCLSLDYKISWPLNIIFSDVVMQQYSKVFKFLLMVSRVFWVLQQDFHILKVARTTSVSKHHHKLQLYQHSMMQFMNALHTYLTCSVLHASWTEFEKDLENATTLDEVYDTHVRYIKKILSRCMLNVRGEGMRTCLCNIFRVVLKFHNRIRACDWSGTVYTRHANPNYENLERMYVTFCEQRAYLAHVAEKLARSGYQPHLMQFLLALNINHRYDLIQRK
ncbi:hypothetical protein QAD02_006242 [Eretmocerus hayati]|uniref:Uncharacterized protein n=1 Tax=Eretmocerus hayati TaxID=131215 RepID=A0ACC2N0D2_9HYME|nr:hypothetical protein QAD02_006242 [Eretmocerus hayati]